MKLTLVTNIFVWTSLLTLRGAEPARTEGPDRPLTEFDGDLHIAQPTVWRDGHYRVRGNLWMDAGGTLTVENSIVELACTHSREFRYKWAGGRLLTTNSMLGGTKVGGAINQVTFDLNDGEWHAKDTTIRYCYGITFGRGETVGKLRADNLIMGENPDTIIMGGKGDVVLRNSTYMISLRMNARQGGKGVLDLPKNTLLTRTFDHSSVPGAEYRLELIDVKVPLWFLFVQIAGKEAPPAEVTLERCEAIIPSLMAHNLKEELRIPCSWKGWKEDGVIGKRFVPVGAGTTFRTGNLKWAIGPRPVHIGTWGIYCTGPETDVTIRGPMNICECFVFAGKLSLLGTPGTHDMMLACTTTEVGRIGEAVAAAHHKEQQAPRPAQAQLIVRDAALGKLVAGEESIRGQICAHPGGRIEIERAKAASLHLVTKGDGEISIKDVRKFGEFEISQHGGPISVEEAAKP